MVSRDIGFILGQHHSHLDHAISHHRDRNGFVFESASIHDSIGEEVVALWFDKSGFPELPASGLLDLHVRCGLAATSKGPIGFILWWLPAVNESGIPRYVNEHIVNPMHGSTREMLRRLGQQKYLHVAMVSAGTHLVGLHEFKNEFGFFDLYSYAQAASEQGWANYDFDAACSAFGSEFDVRNLLDGQYPESTLTAGS
jgi:hypothetical protein